MGTSVCAWAYAIVFMKYLGKVETVFKSNGFCNIDHRHFVMRQQITSLLDAILTQIFFRGLVQYRLKCPAQIAAAQPTYAAMSFTVMGEL